MPAAPVTIIPYESRHAAAFRDLNLAWLKEHFCVEPFDRAELNDPEGNVLAKGGAILVAEMDGKPVGVAALLFIAEGEYELSKMAVQTDLRGRGIGHRLLDASIDYAREQLRARRLILYSNTVLAAAIRLYRERGFREIPLPNAEAYQRANIAMELRLDTLRS